MVVLVWFVLNSSHTGHVADDTFLIVGIDLCSFEVFPEVVYCHIDNLIDIFHIMSSDLPVFCIGLGEASLNRIGDLRI